MHSFNNVDFGEWQLTWRPTFKMFGSFSTIIFFPLLFFTVPGQTRWDCKTLRLSELFQLSWNSLCLLQSSHYSSCKEASPKAVPHLHHIALCGRFLLTHLRVFLVLKYFACLRRDQMRNLALGPCDQTLACWGSYEVTAIMANILFLITPLTRVSLH